MNLINRSLVAAAMLLSGTAAMAQTAATIPASMQGTYEVTFGSAQPGAPLTNGTKATMVIAPGGAICIADYLFSNPVTADNSTAEAVYASAALGLKLRLSNIQSGAFNELNVTSSSDAFLGQLSGSKVSNSTSCALLGGTPPDMTTIADVFRLAEQAYASLFPAAKVDNTFQVIDGFIARSYASTGISIGIRNGTVYVQGGEFGNQPVTIGTVANTRAQLVSAVTGEPVKPVEEPKVDIPTGDYKLTISGVVGATVFGVTTSSNFSLTIDSIKAPDSTTVEELEKDVKDALKDVENVNVATFTDFQISEISVGDSRVFFRAQFKATTTTSGVTVNQSYNITYEYLKK